MNTPQHAVRPIVIKTTLLAGVLLLAALLASVGCSSSSSSPTTPATFDIRGTWRYETLKGTDTWDTGTFTFTGNTTSGNFTQVNIYTVTYTGTYTVSGVNVTLNGQENYTGTLTDATHLTGTWQSNSIAADNGTWTAVKQ